MLEQTGLGRNRRRGAIRMLLAMTLLAALVGSRTAAASGVPEIDTKELLREGFAALKKNDLEAARIAFMNAWKERQHFAVAFSLAEVEMRLGRYVEAAQHWQYALMRVPDDLTDQRQHAAEQLEACMHHIGALTVQVNREGAVIHVDGAPVGEAPLDRELYVPPGDHELYAEKAGERSPIRFFRISADSRLSFSLRLPEPDPKLRASPQDGLPPVVTNAGRPASPGSSSLRMPVLITGLVATLGGAAVGTVFVLKSNGASDDARAAFDQAARQSNPTIEPSTVCGRADKPGACDTALARLDDKDRFRDLAIGSFIASGMFAVGTAAVYWLWPSAAGSTHAAVQAVAHPTQRGGTIAIAAAF